LIWAYIQVTYIQVTSDLAYIQLTSDLAYIQLTKKTLIAQLFQQKALKSATGSAEGTPRRLESAFYMRLS
jgi:hypothetical protein